MEKEKVTQDEKLKIIINLVKTTPNDMDLGKKIRKLLK